MCLLIEIHILWISQPDIPEYQLVQLNIPQNTVFHVTYAKFL